MMATLTAYDAYGRITHQDTREYPNISLVWEHIGCQQHNRTTMRVHVQTDSELEYDVTFSPWTPQRGYVPSRRFHLLLERWAAESAGAE